MVPGGEQLRFLLAFSLCIVTCCGFTVHKGNSCPSQCKCYNLNAIVKCNELPLTAIPNLPKNVRELHMTGNQFHVLKNNSFLNLQFLEHLNLENNKIFQLEPQAFNGLDNLQILKLGNNSISDLPEDLFKSVSRQLFKLDLTGNTFKDVPHLSMKNLQNLVYLNLSYNQIVDPFLGQNFQFTKNLQYLDLSGNNFGTLNANVFQAMLWWDSVHQKHLNLSKCNIKYIHMQAFEKLYHLESLSLSGNGGIPSGILHDALKKLEVASLKHLDLSNMNITNTHDIFSTLQLTALNELDLSRNAIRTIGMRTFTYLPHLQRLDLSYNLIDRVGDLTGLNSLKSLTLSHNKITEIDEMVFESLSESNFEELDLSHNYITQIEDAPFENLFYIQMLDVSYNLIQEFGISASLESLKTLKIAYNALSSLGAIPRLLQLKHLDVSHNQLHKLGTDLFSKSHNLEVADFSHNLIKSISNDTFNTYAPYTIDLSHNKIARLENFGWSDKEVKVLNLEGNGITSMSTKALHGLKWLKVLNLGNNSLMDIWRDNFKDLQNLETLILSNNELANLVRTTNGIELIKHLKSLKTLYLDSNRITQINDYLLSNVTTLARLDLSRNSINNISKKLISHLHSLKYVNLSHNNFRFVDPNIFQGLTSLTTVDLSDNPFECTCDILNFRTWLDRTQVEVTNANLYTCKSPLRWRGQSLRSFQMQMDNCGEEFDKKIIFLVIGAVGLMIILIGAIVFWRHRWRIKRKLAHHQYGVIRDNNSLQLQQQHQHCVRGGRNGNPNGNVWL